MAVVMRMYRFRFDETVPESASLQVIRGMEGARVRKAYAEAAKLYGVRWVARNYDRSDWSKADPLNRALSAANACLNAVCHAAIVSGGYSTALGFVHTGKQLSFVYDVADLYKVKLTVPVAFYVAAEDPMNLEAKVRQKCRQAFKEARLLERILPDIDSLLEIPDKVIDERELDAADDAKPEDWWQPPDGELPMSSPGIEEDDDGSDDS